MDEKSKAYRTSPYLVWAFTWGILLAIVTVLGIGYFLGPLLPAAFFAVAFGSIFGWLLLQSGFAKIYPTDEGMLVKRPLGNRLVPWDEIKTVKWLRNVNTVVFLFRDNTSFFVSRDGFPHLPELIAVVVERSKCEIPNDVARVLEQHKESPRLYWPF